MQTPGAIYDGDYTKLRKRNYEHRIIEPTEMEEELAGRNRPIEKDDSRAPGDYGDQIESHRSTLPEKVECKFNRSELFNFIDHFKRMKKNIPGVGSYFKNKDEIDMLKKLSPLPRDLKIHRH